MNGARSGAAAPGGFELLAEITTTAAGTTYRARSASGSLVAITMLSPVFVNDAARLVEVRDAVQRAGALEHPHIVRVLDFGSDATGWYVIEELVDAEPLTQVLAKRGALGPREALLFARHVADALAYAHEKGVIHGAVGPARILVAGEKARVSGLGLAGDAQPGYATPEQTEGKEPDARSDVFLLGLLMFELLEGRRVFAGDEQEMRRLLLDRKTLLMPRFAHIAPSGVPGLVARAIRRSPAERPATMARMRSEIDACLGRLVEIGGGEKPKRADTRPVKRIVLPDDAFDEPLEAEPTPAVPAARRVAARIAIAASERRPRKSRKGLFAAMIVVGAGLGFAWRYLGEVRKPPTPVAAVPVAPAPTPTEVEPPAPLNEAPAIEATSPPTDAMQPVEPPAPPTEAAQPVEPPAPPAEAVPTVVEPQAAESAPVAPAPEAAPAEPAPAEAAPAAPVLPPRVVSFRPRGSSPVTVAEGAAIAFSAQADRQALYSWLLDGKRAARGPSWRFVAPPAASGATHTVELRVADADGRTAPPVVWNVEVTPRISEANVHDWLERLTAAWQRGDLATLRLYGVVRDDESAVRTRLPRGDGHWVALANQTVRTDGRYAHVGFELVERDGRGKIVGSTPLSYELEKRADGFVAVR